MREPIPFQPVPRLSQWEQLVAAYEDLAAENERLAGDVASATLRGVAIGVVGSVLSSAVLIWVGVWLVR